jgi:RNA polymerase sigma factor (sigma-70 family)
MAKFLPERQRLALERRFIDQMPYSEIAAELGCTLNAARILVYRGLETLRSAFDIYRKVGLGV